MLFYARVASVLQRLWCFFTSTHMSAPPSPKPRLLFLSRHCCTLPHGYRRVSTTCRRGENRSKKERQRQKRRWPGRWWCHTTTNEKTRQESKAIRRKKQGRKVESKTKQEDSTPYCSLSSQVVVCSDKAV